jgi:hypothetical protein
MPFGRLHEEAASDNKLLNLSNAAWRMWGMGLIYCQRNLTDGFIPDDALQFWGIKGGGLKKVAEELCRSMVPGKAAVWAVVAGGFQVHDYLQWNDSKQDILDKRAATAARITKWREREAERKAAAETLAKQNALLARVNASRNAFANEPDVDVVRGRGTYKEKGVAEKIDAPTAVVEAFRVGWRTAYGYDSSLLISPLEFMKLEQQTTNCPLPRLLKAVAAYFATTDPFVRKAKHPFPLFLRDPLKYLATEAADGPRRPPGCQHKPPCGDAVACSQRFLAEQNAL